MKTPGSSHSLKSSLRISPAGKAKVRKALRACADCLQGMQQGCYAFEQGAQAGLVAEGRISKPIRYATTVEGPLRLSGQISRTRQCADHHIVLSSSSTPPSQPGAAHLQSYYEHVQQAVITHTHILCWSEHDIQVHALLSSIAPLPRRHHGFSAHFFFMMVPEHLAA
jgi:hypothetical protein